MIRQTTSLTAAIVMSACVAATDAGDGSPQDPFSAIIDRPLIEVSGRGSITLAPDGTGLGTLDGQRVTVSWVREGDRFCRSGLEGAIPLAFECQTVEIMRGVATFRNADGSISNQYRLG